MYNAIPTSIHEREGSMRYITRGRINSIDKTKNNSLSKVNCRL